MRQKPLTYVPAETPLGAASTLDLRVDGARWREVADFLDAGPRDHVYKTITADDDTITAVFGDGIQGARPSRGTENVNAVYRVGIGRPGNVVEGRLTQLLTRPLRVSAVTNPLPATGGVDRDSIEQARQNTPIGVASMGRLVSLADYEDFACARAGIGKAVARRLSDRRRQVVHLTIAGAQGAPIDVESDLFQMLRRSLADWGDPHRPVVVQVFSDAVVLANIGVRIDADRSWDLTEPVIRAALSNAFCFDRRALGQDVLASEVIATVQAVPGVSYVDLDGLAAVDSASAPAALGRLAGALTGPVPVRLPMGNAVFDGNMFQPARLGVIEATLPETVLLREIRS
jgi:predicted phage baseplate assembly protein